MSENKIATREAYGKTLAKIAPDFPDLVVLDADLSKSTNTGIFKEACPERFFNTGIAEQNMIGVAAGLAACGKIPFVSSFAVFAVGRTFDQIRNTVAYARLNVKIAATHAGITVGEDGGSHQAIEDLALTRSLPGMTVLVPCDGKETEEMIRWAAEYDGPVYIRLGRGAVPQLNADDYCFQPGKGVLLKEGSDVVIFACGVMVAQAMEAAALLEEAHISAAVANIPSIKPLDTDFIAELARKCGAVVTAEEHNIIGGLGSAVAETLVEHTPVPMERVGVRDVFGTSGKPDQLMMRYGLTGHDIVKAAITAYNRK